LVSQTCERRKVNVFIFGLDARGIISSSEQTVQFILQKVDMHSVRFVFAVFSSKIMTLSPSGNGPKIFYSYLPPVSEEYKRNELALNLVFF
jgi:hypothetical protein